ncbi:MAG: nuclear transport factor 2 family protein [Acidimicrobiia bacterium]|nr:nuclear transport factor 2 family protein [Acidimicrobiia bacterium]
MSDLSEVARRLFVAYGRGDLDAVRAALADDVVSHITNASGGTDRVEGADGFMDRLPDVSGATWSTAVTQVAQVDDERVMTMIEVKASRKGKELHNFAAFLTRIAGSKVQELWMVEARPAYSDEFWSA